MQISQCCPKQDFIPISVLEQQPLYQRVGTDVMIGDAVFLSRGITYIIYVVLELEDMR